MPVVIPASHRAVLRLLLEMPDEAFDEVLATMTSTPPMSPKPTVVERLLATSADLDRASATTLVDAVISAGATAAQPGLETGELANEISQDEELDVADPDSQERLRTRLLALMDTPFGSLTSKALNVLSEYSNRFLGVRVLTDLRPIFGRDPDERPVGAVLAHTLKIDFVGEEEHSHTFYVVLDDDDVVSVKEQMIRAERKARSLRKLAKEMNLPYFEPIESEDEQ